MIVTDNAIYLHLPKTGGTWMRDVLQPIMIDHRPHSVPTRELTDKYTQVFVAVRNPWAWYASLYNFIKNGSDRPDIAIHNNHLFIAFGREPSFDEFVEMLVNPTDLYKKQVRMLVKMQASVNNRPLESPVPEYWLTHPVGFYQAICDVFFEHSTEFGMMETLQTDLSNAIEKFGDMSEEVTALLAQLPRQNSSPSYDYRAMYNEHTQALVGQSSKSIIDRFNYKF